MSIECEKNFTKCKEVEIIGNRTETHIFEYKPISLKQTPNSKHYILHTRGNVDYLTSLPNFNTKKTVITDELIFNKLKQHQLFFYKEKDKKIQLIANALYIEYNRHEYILSVGHTFGIGAEYQLNPKHVYIGPINYLVSDCNGVIHLPAEQNNFHEMDYCVLLVSKKLKKKLCSFGLSPYKLMDSFINDQYYYDVSQFIFGYPASQKKNDFNLMRKSCFHLRMIDPELPLKMDKTPLSIIDTERSKNVYPEGENIRHAENIVVDFDERLQKTEDIGTKHTCLAPNLHGLSGSGIWAFPLYPFCTQTYVFQGFFIGQSKNKKYLIGLKNSDIHFIIEKTVEPYFLYFKLWKIFSFGKGKVIYTTQKGLKKNKLYHTPMDTTKSKKWSSSDCKQ